MSQFVCSTANVKCMFGDGPATLNILPVNRVFLNKKPMGTIMDNQPMVNIPTFGMCKSLANPAVASATAAALGTLTPQPCVPVITGPWFPGNPKVMIRHNPALMMTDKCMCAWAGMIEITSTGQ
ncbi:MAG: DUF4280 domain-containing protein [Bacteroidales bacterium]|nr:DUF4280 domain-containing protein [Bacteroidales bacterium]